MKLLRKIIDANVILRFFLADNEQQHAKACTLMESLEFGSEEVLLTEIVFAEVVWVLNKVYKIPRPAITQQFSRLINFRGFSTLYDKKIFVDSLELYAAQTMDIQDILLAVLAKSVQGTIITFDKKDFKKLGSNFISP